jgi:hypothetical protein
MCAMAERTAATLIESELATGRATLSALESRAFGVLTLDVAAVTLYLALRDRLAWEPVALGSAGFWAFCLAVALVVASLGSAATCAVPSRSDELPVAVLMSNPETLMAARVAQLERQRRIVLGRTRRTRLSLVLGLAALGDVALLTWWASAGW